MLLRLVCLALLCRLAAPTTTLAFRFDGGVVVAADSRASLGAFVGSRSTMKILPISPYSLGTMAGGAADCSHFMRRLAARSRLWKARTGKDLSAPRAARILATELRQLKEDGLELSVGSMVTGHDELGLSRLFYVDNDGVIAEGDLFSVGSGSTYAYGVLDREYRADLDEAAAVRLAERAIRRAAARDAYSGGFVNVFLIPKPRESNGWGEWRHVVRQDIGERDGAAKQSATSVEMKS